MESELMVEKIKKTIKDNNLIGKNEKIVVGVSGGPDSMCLLQVLIILKNELNFNLVVAHINHMIRKEANSETKYVEDFCKKNNIECFVKMADVLKLADNSREAKRIINSGNVLVDGRVVKDYKFPVGFMDIIEIPKTGESYRVLLDRKGRLQLDLIEDSSAKLSKIVNKSTIKGGKTQLNLHDGKNVIIDEDAYSVGDVICLKVPEQEIVEVYPLQEGATVLVTGGKHTGELGTVSEIIENKSSNPNTIIIENSAKDEFLTLKDYAFVVGGDEPTISLLEVNK